MSRYSMFDRSRLRLRPLAEREHDMHLDDVLPLLDLPTSAALTPFTDEHLPELVERIVAARSSGRPVILMMGAHVIKQGCSRFICAMLRRGMITHVAGNGACAIHDYELARIGATTESVARYIREGQFGLWQEDGEINTIAAGAAVAGLGLGEAVGDAIVQGALPHRDLSIFATAHELGVPATVHVGIGYDIIDELPNFNGAAFGQASYNDFLIFAAQVENLEGGVLLNFGTAVMGPEVYLKALSMARNVARQGARDTPLHNCRFRHHPDRGRLSSPGRQKRARLLLPSVEDHPRAHRGRWRAELLLLRGSPPDCPQPLSRPCRAHAVDKAAAGAREPAASLCPRQIQQPVLPGRRRQAATIACLTTIAALRQIPCLDPLHAVAPSPRAHVDGAALRQIDKVVLHRARPGTCPRWPGAAPAAAGAGATSQRSPTPA